MKRLSIVLALLLTIASSFGQGLIYFNTRVLGVVDAPVTLSNGMSPGPDYSAQLIEVRADGSLTPLVPATTFRGGSAEAQKYVFPDTLFVPDVPNGG